MDVELDLRLSFGRGELAEADERFFALLRGVDAHGSLRRASEVAGLSYRAAWGLLRDWTERLGRPPVEMHRGRGAVLSELGRKLLWADQFARDRLSATMQAVAEELGEALEPVTTGRPGRGLTVFASHSMAQDILRDLAERDAGISLDFHNHGSLDSLRALAGGDCDLAGFHLAEGSLRRRLLPSIRPLLNDDEHCLVRVAARRQGLLLSDEADGRVAGLRDLAESGLRFVNRQVGSGTRLLLDVMLNELGIDPARIQGYNHEEFTHSAVAALLRSGAADAGFGVEAAAARFGLAFLPLASETYYFAVGRETLRRHPAAADLVGVIAGAAFRERAGALRGYDPRESGRIERVSTLLAPVPA